MRVRGGGATPPVKVDVQTDFKAKQKQLDQSVKKYETAKVKREKAERELDKFEGSGSKIAQLQSQRSEAKKAMDASPRHKLPTESTEQYQARMKKQQMDIRAFGQTSEERDFKDLDDSLKAARQKVYAGSGPLQEKVKAAKTEEQQARKEVLSARKEMKTAVKRYAPVVEKRISDRADALDAKREKAGKRADILEPEIQTKTVEYQHREYKTKDHKGKTKTHRVQLPAKTTTIYRTAAQKEIMNKHLAEYKELRKEEGEAFLESLRVKKQTGKWKKDQLAALDDVKKKVKD